MPDFTFNPGTGGFGVSGPLAMPTAQQLATGQAVANFLQALNQSPPAVQAATISLIQSIAAADPNLDGQPLAAQIAGVLFPAQPPAQPIAPVVLQNVPPPPVQPPPFQPPQQPPNVQLPPAVPAAIIQPLSPPSPPGPYANYLSIFDLYPIPPQPGQVTPSPSPQLPPNTQPPMPFVPQSPPPFVSPLQVIPSAPVQNIQPFMPPVPFQPPVPFNQPAQPFVPPVANPAPWLGGKIPGVQLDLSVFGPSEPLTPFAQSQGYGIQAISIGQQVIANVSPPPPPPPPPSMMGSQGPDRHL